MIRVGKKDITELDPSNKFRKHYEECMEWLKNNKPIIVKMTEDKIRKPNPLDPDDRGETSTGSIIKFYNNFTINGVTEIIRYYQNITVENNGVEVFGPPTFDHRATYQFKDEEMEQAYFLIFISPYCKKLLDPDAAKLQTTINKRKHYYIEDRAREVKATVNLEVLKSQVSLMLFAPGTAISFSQLKDIAMSYGVPLADQLLEDELRIAMRNKVLERPELTPNERSRLMSDFLNDCESDSKVKLRSNVLRAIENKFVKTFVVQGGRLKWYYVDEKGEKGDAICGINNNQDKVNSLVRYFSDHSEAFDQLMEILNAEKVL